MRDLLALGRVALSILASAMTVSSVLLLGADSDGPTPGWPIVVAVVALLAVGCWPMTRRRPHLAVFVAALAVLQLSGHALLLLAATGHLWHAGVAGLFCCPASPLAAGGGVVATLTADAGWLLFGVQLLAVLLLSLPLRTAQAAALDLASAVAAAVRAAMPGWDVVVGLPSRGCDTVTRSRLRPRPTTRRERSGVHAIGAVQRRGPPAAVLLPPSRSSLARPWGACAA